MMHAHMAAAWYRLALRNRERGRLCTRWTANKSDSRVEIDPNSHCLEEKHRPSQQSSSRQCEKAPQLTIHNKTDTFKAHYEAWVKRACLASEHYRYMTVSATIQTRNTPAATSTNSNQSK